MSTGDLLNDVCGAGAVQCFAFSLFPSATSVAATALRFPLCRYPLVRRHLPCTCGRRQLAFLAASATGGARKPNPSGEGHPPLAVRSQSARRKPCTGKPRVALHCRGACRTNYARLRRADLIRHGAAQRRSTVPPSPRGRLSTAITTVPHHYKNAPPQA